MRKNLLAGLVILVPIALTFGIIHFFIDLLTTPFLGGLQALFSANPKLQYYFNLLEEYNLAIPVSKFLILILLFIAVVVIGIIGRNWVVNTLFAYIDSIAHKIPIFRGIYKPMKEAVNSLLSPDSTGFSDTVLVPFPNTQGLAMGFVTSDRTIDDLNSIQKEKVTVFVPGTPNPTAGYLLLFDKSQIHYLSMSVEEGMKFVISCGVINANISPVDKMNIQRQEPTV